MPGLTPAALRRLVLQQSKRANVGHIGSALSVVEILAALHGGMLRASAPDDMERDRFVLSKGHAALALYATLFLNGVITQDQLDTYCGNDSQLGVHPEHCLAGIDFSTGSLGHGLSIGAGAALAARLDGSERKVFVLVSDAECNEGALWEAVAFAAHHRLSALIAIVDANGQQALGHTRDVLDMSPLGARWEAFGWRARTVDGHDLGALRTALVAAREATDSPQVIIARTVAGKGVSYMERQVKWHYWPMSDEQYAQALKEIEAAE